MLCKSYSIVLKFLLNIFDYLIARVIGFLAMYHDGVLCVTNQDREALLGQNMPFLECYAVALLFLSFLYCYCIMSEHKNVFRLLVA